MTTAWHPRRWAPALCLILLAAIPASSRPCGPWRWLNPRPQGNDLVSMAFADGRFVAVGLHGTVATSTDGAVWAVRDATTVEDLLDIAWGGGRFVAVGTRGTVVMSADGVHWQHVVSGTIRDLKTIAWNGSGFLVLSESYDVLVSTDGELWTVTEIPPMDPEDLAWGSGRYVALWGERIVVSDDGLEWSDAVSDTGEVLHELRWTGDAFIAVGDGGAVWLSDDGLSWTGGNAGTSRDLYGVVWEGEQYVVVGRTGLVLTSYDGLEWERQESVTNQSLFAVAHGDELFVAVGATGSTVSSSFAREWTLHSSLVTTADLVDVAGAGARMVALPGRVGAKKASSLVYVSDDGRDWQEWPLGINAELEALACSNDRCVVVGEGIALAAELAGGAWHPTTLGGVVLDGVAWDGIEFAAVGHRPSSGAVAVFTSADGVAWQDRSPGSPGRLNDVVSNGFWWLAVGERGAVFTSADGTVWIAGNAGTTKNFRAVTWTGSQFVAVGERELIATSYNGSEWVEHNPPERAVADKAGVVSYHGVAASAVQVIIVGDEGAMLVSSDGALWRQLSPPTLSTLAAAAWDGKHFMIVGEGGTMLRSACPERARVGGDRARP